MPAVEVGKNFKWSFINFKSMFLKNTLYWNSFYCWFSSFSSDEGNGSLSSMCSIKGLKLIRFCTRVVAEFWFIYLKVYLGYKILSVYMTKSTSIKEYRLLLVMLLHMHSRHSTQNLDLHWFQTTHPSKWCLLGTSVNWSGSTGKQQWDSKFPGSLRNYPGDSHSVRTCSGWWGRNLWSRK